MKTHKELVLKHLKRNKRKGITSLDAIELYGDTRLASTIFDLRQDGYDIITNMVQGKNRYGRPIEFAQYVLKGEIR